MLWNVDIVMITTWARPGWVICARSLAAIPPMPITTPITPRAVSARLGIESAPPGEAFAGRSTGRATGRSRRPNMATSGASVASRMVNHNGRVSHHCAVPAEGWVMSRRATMANTTSNALRCHRNTVMITPLTATTADQVRSRCNQRASAGRASMTSATCMIVSTTKHSVGGFMLLAERAQSNEDRECACRGCFEGCRSATREGPVGIEEPELLREEPHEQEIQVANAFGIEAETQRVSGNRAEHHCHEDSAVESIVETPHRGRERGGQEVHGDEPQRLRYEFGSGPDDVTPDAKLGQCKRQRNPNSQ
jgi:hypothetical protein